MEHTRTSLWLFLLLNQLPFCPTHADISTTKPSPYNTAELGGSAAPTVVPSLNTVDHTNFTDIDFNGTRACLIDTEMCLIALGSAGGLIVCLLVVVVVLACQVYHIQRRVHLPRTSRSNMDLVSGTDYWGTDEPESGGLVGPCDASVMLEEVREDQKMEEERQAEIREEATEQAWPGHEEGATAMAFDPKEKPYQMQSSSSRDSCLEVPRDLEDMPLVV